MASHQSLHTNEHGGIDDDDAGGYDDVDDDCDADVDGDDDGDDGGDDFDVDDDDDAIFSLFRDKKDQLCPSRAKPGDLLFQVALALAQYFLPRIRQKCISCEPGHRVDRE